MNLKGKSALITGASSGIGESFAHLLASKGSNVVLVARSMDKLHALASTLEEKYGVHAKAYQQDLSQKGAAETLYNALQTDEITIDLLINNAGFGKWGDFGEFSLDEYDRMIQLNVNSLMELCYLFLEDLKQKSEAGIINVGSTASLLPVPYSSVYAATKAFVLFLSEGLTGELEGTNVKVHCLCPAGTATNFANVASNSANASTEGMKSPDQVVQEGLNAFLAEKHYVVTGRKFTMFLTRILSRRRIIRMVADYWRKELGK